MCIPNVLIQHYGKIKRNLSNHLLPLNECLFFNFILISKFWNMEITEKKLPMIQPKLSFISIHNLWVCYNTIHTWITVNITSWSNVLGRKILPMHRIQSLTRRKFNISGLPLSAISIVRELTLLTFSNFIFMRMGKFLTRIPILMRYMLIEMKGFCLIRKMPYLPPIRICYTKMSLILIFLCNTEWYMTLILATSSGIQIKTGQPTDILHILMKFRICSRISRERENVIIEAAETFILRL